MKLVCVVCLTEFDAAEEGEECPMCFCRQTKEKIDEKGGSKP
jgi:rRNA maturation endonuclease Nob1